MITVYIIWQVSWGLISSEQSVRSGTVGCCNGIFSHVSCPLFKQIISFSCMYSYNISPSRVVYGDPHEVWCILKSPQIDYIWFCYKFKKIFPKLFICYGDWWYVCCDHVNIIYFNSNILWIFNSIAIRFFNNSVIYIFFLLVLQFLLYHLSIASNRVIYRKFQVFVFI